MLRKFLFSDSSGLIIPQKTREEEQQIRHPAWKNVIGSFKAYFVGYDADPRPQDNASFPAKDIAQTPNN